MWELYGVEFRAEIYISGKFFLEGVLFIFVSGFRFFFFTDFGLIVLGILGGVEYRYWEILLELIYGLGGVISKYFCDSGYRRRMFTEKLGILGILGESLDGLKFKKKEVGLCFFLGLKVG